MPGQLFGITHRNGRRKFLLLCNASARACTISVKQLAYVKQSAAASARNVKTSAAKLRSPKGNVMADDRKNSSTNVSPRPARPAGIPRSAGGGGLVADADDGVLRGVAGLRLVGGIPGGNQSAHGPRAAALSVIPWPPSNDTSRYRLQTCPICRSYASLLALPMLKKRT